MDFGVLTKMIQKALLVFFVLIISMLIGWYSEKAVEKFMLNNKTGTIQGLNY